MDGVSYLPYSVLEKAMLLAGLSWTAARRLFDQHARVGIGAQKNRPLLRCVNPIWLC